MDEALATPGGAGGAKAVGAVAAAAGKGKSEGVEGWGKEKREERFRITDNGNNMHLFRHDTESILWPQK